VTRAAVQARLLTALFAVACLASGLWLLAVTVLDFDADVPRILLAWPLPSVLGVLGLVGATTFADWLRADARVQRHILAVSELTRTVTEGENTRTLRPRVVAVSKEAHGRVFWVKGLEGQRQDALREGIEAAFCTAFPTHPIVTATPDKKNRRFVLVYVGTDATDDVRWLDL